MPKIIKFIIAGIIAIVISYFAHLFINSIRYGYHIDLKNPEPYLWMFKDSVRKDIDPHAFVGSIRDKDVCYHYNYQKYHITIWEFKELSIAQLKIIPINLNQDLENVKLVPGVTLHSGYSPEYTIKYGAFFNSSMEINLDQLSSIDTTFETPNYKGFYGKLHKISFSEQGNTWVMIDYLDEHPSTLFLIYKKYLRFFIIKIDCDNSFDASKVIKILNLI